MRNRMMFFDCNCYIGQPSGGGPAASAEELTAAMDRAGIAGALVWHVAQRDLDPLTGNDLLERGIAGRQRLLGCWTILPPQTGELGRPAEWLARALAAGVRAFRAFPDENRYLLRADAVGGLLELMIAARAPLIVSVGKQWQGVYDLLGELPELTVILSDLGCWGADRYFRPLIERYTNVHLDISDYMLDGGIEAFVADYGAGRMLFGSGFPAAYHGAMMLALARAEISDADKQAIAAGNLRRLTGEVST